MNVKLDLEKNTCFVEKEIGDKRFSHSGYAEAESTFFFNVLQILKAQGYDVIKKRMAKDGCLVDDTQQWIRTRKFDDKNPDGFALFNSRYALEDLGLEFNKIVVGESIYVAVFR
jgi:hypothetical protein